MRLEVVLQQLLWVMLRRRGMCGPGMCWLCRACFPSKLLLLRMPWHTWARAGKGWRRALRAPPLAPPLLAGVGVGKGRAGSGRVGRRVSVVVRLEAGV